MKVTSGDQKKPKLRQLGETEKPEEIFVWFARAFLVKNVSRVRVFLYKSSRITDTVGAIVFYSLKNLPAQPRILH